MANIKRQSEEREFKKLHLPNTLKKSRKYTKIAQKDTM
jgi:hypothetical protein